MKSASNLTKIFKTKNLWSNNSKFSLSLIYRRNFSDNSKYNEYRHPLITRYTSKDMRKIWSEQEKFATWRKLWVALAQAQMELGLNKITEDIVAKMKKNINDIDFKYAEEQERKLRHDVMSHIHTFGKQVPDAAGIIHLGATSCYVQDNGDLCQMKKGGEVIKSKLLKLIQELRIISLQYKDMPCLAYTHLQPAQLTTVGKRMSLYLQDFYLDWLNISKIFDELPFRSVKGTTGTQASFLNLFNGDHDKVKKLEKRVAELMGFNNIIQLSGQTYTRKIDYNVLASLSGIGQSAHKMCNDIRILSSFQEIGEPFEKNQVGSSAMAYKQNPMRSERVCSLSRYVMSLPNPASETHALQWMERTLDDSAIRRMIIPESFLCSDAILDICYNIIHGITVWPNVIKKRIEHEIPFMTTENIIMEAVKHGGNRQELHEIIRNYSFQASKDIKEEGKPNNLLENIKQDKAFAKIKDKIDQLIDPQQFIGRAPQQVEEFCHEIIDPLLNKNKQLLNSVKSGEVQV